MGIDAVLEAMLIALARVAPSVIHVISDALRGGDSPEVAVGKAKALTPPRLDTTAEDEERRERIRRAGLIP